MWMMLLLFGSRDEVIVITVQEHIISHLLVVLFFWLFFILVDQRMGVILRHSIVVETGWCYTQFIQSMKMPRGSDLCPGDYFRILIGPDTSNTNLHPSSCFRFHMSQETKQSTQRYHKRTLLEYSTELGVLLTDAILLLFFLRAQQVPVGIQQTILTTSDSYIYFRSKMCCTLSAMSSLSHMHSSGCCFFVHHNEWNS